MKDRHKIVPAAYAVILAQGKVLLMLRQNTGFKDGEWGLPAGHVEEHETFTDAIIREAYEEAGIVARKDDIQVLHIMQRYSKDSPKHLRDRVDAFFGVEKYEGKVRNAEPEKCAAVKWFPLDDLPPNTIDYIRDVLTKIHEQVHYSEWGFEDVVR